MPRSTRIEIHYGDRLVTCFADRPANVTAMLLAAADATPKAIALQDGDQRLSYRVLAETTARLAAGLAARGVGRGDRVGILIDNRAEFVLAVLSCAWLGAIAVPMGTRLRGPEIAHICNDAGVGLILHETALADQLPAAGAAPGPMRRIAVAGACPGSEPFAALLDAAPIPPADLGEDEALCIMYTSGTTGRPKGAIVTHFGAVHSCLHWQEHLGLPPGISTLLAIPCSHIAGLAGVVLPFLHLRGRVILMRAFRAAEALALLSAERVEHALMVPAMYNLIGREPGFENAPLDAWKWAVFGGAMMPEPTIRRFATVLPALQMCNAYGATETTSPATIMPPGAGTAHADSIGRTVHCGDIRVMDEAGCELPPGEAGELFISGPMIVPGYWRNETATRESFPCGYWRSGDIGTVDAEGFVRILDRKKDMIVRGGFKVYPAEVENVLSDHPQIVEAAVVGLADTVMGERVVAVVQQAASGLAPETVRAYCAERLADYKCPQHVLVLDGPLPRNANGKLQKQEIRAIAGAHLAAEGLSAAGGQRDG